MSNMIKEVVGLQNVEIISAVGMKDIMHLAEQEKEELKDALVRTNGSIQFWIHGPFNPNQRCYPPVNRYMTDFEDLVAKSSERMPAVTFIESPLVSDPKGMKLIQGIEYYTSIKSRPLLYYIRTYDNDPTPSLTQEVRRPRMETNWDLFTQVLKEFGVKSVIVSGKHYEEEPVVDPYFRGCVGYTVDSLEKRGIRCFQSVVTFPDVKGHLGYIPNRSNQFLQLQELIVRSRNSRY